MSVTTAGSYSSRWGRLIPIAFITYSLAYVDRANYSFGAAGGMAHDLKIDATAGSLLGALFFLGYFFFQVPAAYYAEKRSAKDLIFWSLILWGIFAAATGLLSDIRLLYLDRFVLGVMESVVLPGMLIFLGHWFTKEERSRANTFLILGNPITVLWMSIVSGYLVQAFGWRGMFIVEGAPPIIWAFVWRAMVEDWPRDAAWLDPDERAELERKLEDEQRQFAPVRDYAAAFRTPSVIALAIQYFCWSIGVYGFVIWLPSMLKAAGESSIVLLGWLSAGPYLAAAVLMVIGSYFSDASGDRKNFVWPFLLIGAVAFYGSYLVGTSSFWLGYYLLVLAGATMYAPYGPFFAWIAEMLPRNVAGGAIALINCFGALGSFVGSYFVGWLNGVTGGSGASFLFMAAALLVSVVLTLTLRRPGNVEMPARTAT
ncbi:MFS transporter [Bradyrhizobium sp.]|uniref:MFS transporter n=1 Tax=Bradyrhizobium sp. TaxID=376 RepID=UPI002D696F65|nr:MFS transporter [Bradyrhizobium sp.]HZR76621.1 MFS transporter [Bradyrhizobium sp.]